MIWGGGIHAAAGAAASVLDPNVIVPAAITGIVALVGAYLTYKATQRKSHSASAPETEVHVETSPLANFSGTIGDFAQLIVEENREQRIRLRALEVKQEETQSMVSRLQDELASTQRSHTTFEDAVRRYLKVIADYIGELGGIMPRPDTTDIPVLDRTLPRPPVR